MVGPKLRTLALGALSSLIAGCVAEPDPLPTEILVAAADARIERAGEPPLYQMLYDYAFLPKVQYKEQRVRILIWLRHMELDEYQLRSLKALHQSAESERARIEQAQAEVIRAYEARIAPIYEQLWGTLAAGASVQDPALEQAAQALLSERLMHARERDLLRLRLQGVREIRDLSDGWLAQLRPRQEALLTDAIFFLRHRLDPYANPGDFRALIGSVFVAGDYGTLTRGSFDAEKDHLNLSALWTEQALEDLQGPVFNQARRDLVLYMILMEPALPEAIDAALEALAAGGGEPDGAAGEGGEPPPGGPPGSPNGPPSSGGPPPGGGSG